MTLMTRLAVLSSQISRFTNFSDNAFDEQATASA